MSALTPLTPEELGRMDAYWRAANYLAVGQIYLLDNRITSYNVCYTKLLRVMSGIPISEPKLIISSTNKT